MPMELYKSKVSCGVSPATMCRISKATIIITLYSRFNGFIFKTIISKYFVSVAIN